METISLRRTKDSKNLVGLPDKIMQTCYVELSPQEREQYDRMETEAKSALRDYLDNDTVMQNYSCILQIILRLRQICDDVALCPSDLKSLISSHTLEGIIFSVAFFLLYTLKGALLPDFKPLILNG